MEATFLFFSHSENNDLWGYMTHKLFHLPAEFKKYICIENGADTTPLNFFDKVLFYEESDSYDKRLAVALEAVSTKYVILIHDNDLIIEFDNLLFTRLVTAIEKNNIDRCMFGVVSRESHDVVSVSETDAICKTNDLSCPYFMLPFDVGPSVWNVASLKAALAVVPNTQYRDIESSLIQDYCKKKLNMYGFLTNRFMPSVYVVGRPFYPNFQFLHIFTRRKLMYPQMYMDQMDNLVKIIESYPAIGKREVLDHLINIYSKEI